MKKNVVKILMYALLIICTIISLFPFVWTFIASTHTTSQIFNFSYTLKPQGHFIENLRSLEKLTPIWKNLANSLFITITYTVAVLILDSMAGYAFAKYKFRFKNALFFLVLITLMIPQQVIMVPLFLEMNKIGWINKAQSIILPSLANVFGVFLMKQNMYAFPDELIEAARIDGASEIGIFFKVVLPTMKPALASLGILSFMQQWGNFMWPLIALNSKEQYTLPLTLSLLVTPGNVIDYGAVMVGAVITLVPVIVFFLIFQKNFISGMLSGSIKG